MPDALLFIAPGCPHCAAVLDAMTALVKEGDLARLEVVNLAVEPERGRELGVRAVPWVRIGPFRLTGLRGPEELRRWATLAGQEDGMTAYLGELLATGDRRAVEAMVREDPSLLPRLADLLADPETGLNARIGVMATLEELQGSGLGAALVARLGEVLKAGDPRLRADACHALALTGSPEARPFLESCLEDPDAEVRDTARDALDPMHDGPEALR